MLCDHCERGLGHVSELIETYNESTGCFAYDCYSHACQSCRGTGGFCGICLLNLLDCTCPEPETERPRRPSFN